MAWFKAELIEVSNQLPGLYKDYRLSELLMLLYRLTWDDFCGWYLEMIKPQEGKTLNKETFVASLSFFRIILMQFHPVMPFITEELWEAVNSLDHYSSVKKFKEVKDPLRSQSIMYAQISELAPWLDALHLDKSHENIWAGFTNKTMKPSITEIRNIRNTYKIPMKEALVLGYLYKDSLDAYAALFQKLAGIRELKKLDKKPENTVNFSFGEVEFFLCRRKTG
jgi:valyl-tRNA synthetase